MTVARGRSDRSTEGYPGNDPYRSLVDDLPVGLFRTTPEPGGRFLMANEVTARIHGFDSIDDLLAVPVLDLYSDPSDRLQLMEQLDAYGRVQDWEIRLQRRDGTQFWGMITARLVRDDSGQAQYLDGIVEDITDRRRMETELRQAQQKLEQRVEERTAELTRTNEALREQVEERRRIEAELREKEAFLGGVFDAIQDGISVLDKDYRIVRVNKHMEQMYADQGPLIGKTCFQTYANRDEVCPSCPTQAAMETGRPARTTVPYEVGGRQNGTLALSSFPLKDASGHVIGVIEHVQDITDRERTTDLLQIQRDLGVGLGAARDSTEAFDRLMDAATRIDGVDCGGIYVADPETGGLDLVFGKDLSDRFMERVRHYDADTAQGELVRQGRSVFTLMEDFKGVPREILADEGFRSVGVIPIHHDGRVVASLNVASYSLEAFPASSQHALETIGSQIGGVIARLHIEESLQQREAHYRSLIENVSDLIVILSDDGTVRYQSPSFETHLGYDRDETVGLNVFELVHQEDRARVQERFLLGLDKPGYIETVGLRFRRKDGQWRYLEATGTNLLHDPAVRGIVVSSRDATERQQAERQLRRSEKHFRSLTENISDLIAIVSPDGTIIYQSPSYQRLLGYEEGELVGKLSFDYVHPDDVEHVAEMFLESLNKPGLVRTTEVRFKHRDGSWRYFEATGTNLLHDPAVRGIVINSRDIAERKEAELRLRASEEHFRSLIENASDLIAVLEEDGTFKYQSPSFTSVMGYGPGELLGRNAFELVHPEDTSRVQQKFEEGNRAPGHVETVAFRMRHRDGSWRDLEVTGTNLLNDPAVRGAVMNARDITERKREEEARLVFTRTIEQSRDAVIITDANRTISLANKAAEQLFGFTNQEMQGRRPGELFKVDQDVLDTVWSELKRKHRWVGRLFGHNKDGRPFEFESTMMLIVDDNNRPIGTVGFHRDSREANLLTHVARMTEDAAEAKVADAESIRLIMSHLPELVGLERWGIYLHDPEEETLKAAYWSPSSQPIAESVPSMRVTGTIHGQAFETGEIICSRDILNDPVFAKSPVFQQALNLARDESMRATCILPLRGGGRILGTLSVSDARVRTFTPSELDALKALAGQVGQLLNRRAGSSPRTGRRTSRSVSDGPSVVSESEAMKRVMRSVQRVAQTTMPVTLLGPTGAGKGHLAKYIHSISPRSNGPFLAVNCACLDGELILSELFGHERGAFTGAVRQQKGCFELANGGTLLLDEVIELPLSAQAKLLQLIETQQFRRLGGQQTITTDVRLVCTTNADVRECVRSGKMRQDLYYRLNAAEVTVPPLRDRPEDIAPLALAFLRTHAMATGDPTPVLTQGALARLREYTWPGNVRELQNTLALAVSHGSAVIETTDLTFFPAVTETCPPPSPGQHVDERQRILEALQRNAWNRTLTAEELGVHRNTLRNWMRKHRIFE